MLDQAQPTLYEDCNCAGKTRKLAQAHRASQVQEIQNAHRRPCLSSFDLFLIITFYRVYMRPTRSLQYIQKQLHYRVLFCTVKMLIAAGNIFELLVHNKIVSFVRYKCICVLRGLKRV